MNSKELKVSVLMPVYNGMPLIKASIESLMRQTYTNWECVIVDDGSTDGTSEYLDSLTDKRFVINHFFKNYGRPIARQKTLEMASGEYIAMLDAEDLYAPEKLEKQLDIFCRNPDIVLVGCRMCSFGLHTPLLRVRGSSEDEMVSAESNRLSNHAASMLIASKAKKLKYNPKLITGQDTDFLERYLNGCSHYEMHDILYYYSEMDSVSKHKIRKTYKLTLQRYCRQHNVRKMLLFFAKYIYSLVIFPFVTIEEILARRGQPLSEEEIKKYQNDCKSIVDRVKQQ